MTDAQTKAAQPKAAELQQAPQGGAVATRPAPANDAMTAMIERMVGDPSIDLDRLKTLLGLRKEMEADAQRRAFNSAMVVVKSKIPIIVRNAENSDNHSQYATLDKIGEQIDHVLAENGIATSFYPVSGARDGYVKVECVVSHDAGFERRFEAEVPYDTMGAKGGVTKTQIHGWRSATTYARRTLYEMIFDVKSRKWTLDDDAKAAGEAMAATITEVQATEIRRILKDTGSDEAKFLATAGAESIETMTLDQWAKVRPLLATRKKTAAAKKAGRQ